MGHARLGDKRDADAERDDRELTRRLSERTTGSTDGACVASQRAAPMSARRSPQLTQGASLHDLSAPSERAPGRPRGASDRASPRRDRPTATRSAGCLASSSPRSGATTSSATSGGQVMRTRPETSRSKPPVAVVKRAVPGDGAGERSPGRGRRLLDALPVEPGRLEPRAHRHRRGRAELVHPRPALTATFAKSRARAAPRLHVEPRRPSCSTMFSSG